MTRERPNPRWWLLILLLWLLHGLCSSMQTYYVFRSINRPLPGAAALQLGLAYSLLWAALTPAILALARRFPMGWGRLSRSLPVHLAASFAVGLLQRGAFILVQPALVSMPSQSPPWEKALRDLVATFDTQAMIYWVVLAIHESAQLYRKYQEGQTRASQLEALLAQAQLQGLKMQLHPHFLFNTLNTISSMIHVNARVADRMTVRLSEFLRMSLDNVGTQEVTLEAELRFIRCYLEIEQIRFEERLRVEYRIGRDTPDAVVPNLLLQPLVENAIRHGIAKRTQGGCLEIGSWTDGAWLVLTVRDDGPGLAAGAGRPAREGVGSANTRARLRQLYGEEHLFLVRNRSDGPGVEAHVRIPLRRQPAAVLATGPTEEDVRAHSHRG